MNNFTFYAPTRIVFGRDTQRQVGALAAAAGLKKALIHYGGGSVVTSGLLEQVKASLSEKGLGWTELGGVKPNPELALVREGIALCRKEGVDFVLALGGGSAIDSAKLIAVGAVHDDDPWVFSSKEKAPAGALPLGVVLTLAASGSEMSASCVVTKEEGMLKRGYNSDYHRPLFAICNPELTYTLPPYQTGCGIVDILMHTLERYFSDGSDTPLTDRLAEGLMKSVIEAGTAAIADPRNYEARATLMWAGSLSHNDLTGCGRNLFFPVHQMEHEVSGMYSEVAHGAGLAVLFPAWMKYVYRRDLDRFVRFAVEVMGCDLDWEHPERSAREGIARLEAYFQAIGMPVTMEELGITDESKFDEMAEKCTFFGKRTLSARVELKRDDILAVYRLARAGRLSR